MDTTLTMLVKKLLLGNGIYLIGSIIALLIIGYVILCILAWISDKQRDIIGKYYRPKKIMNASEEKFFNLLCRAVPVGCSVFPHVSMRALIETNHWDMWAPFNLKRVDFVICNAALNIVCVVELEGENEQKRHLRREKMLQNAGVNILRYRLSEEPTADQIRADIKAFAKEDGV
ncbi:MAG: DUF2726 domain-containing protein [Alphaproteobacteria bacterium]|nr:DUF2726 domain-containing protein [Alphaproteobacteria bacterium]